MKVSYLLKFSVTEIITFSIFFIYGLMMAIVPSIDFLPIYNVTITGKFIVFSIGAIILFFLNCLLFVREIKLHRINIIDVIVVILFLYILIHRFINGNISDFSIRFYELICLLIFYWAIRLNRNIAGLKFVSLCIVLGGMFQILVGFFQLLGFLHSNSEFDRVTGSFFNSGPYAGFLVSVFLISISLSKQIIFRSYSVKLLLFANIVGTILMLPILHSRAALLAAVIGTICVYRKEVLSKAKEVLHKKNLKVIFLVGGFFLLTALFYMLVISKQQSSEGRILILKNTVRMLLEHPLTGVGYDKFKASYMGYQADYFRDHRDSNETLRADNVYYAFCEPLQLLAENGIVAFFLILVLLYFLGKCDKSSPFAEMTMTGGIAILIFSIFSYSSQILPIKMIQFYYMAVLSCHYSGPYLKDIRFDRASSRRWNKAIFGVILLIGACFVPIAIRKEINLYKSFAEWEKAMTLYNMGAINESYIAFQSQYPVLKKEGDYLIAYGKNSFLLGKYSDAVNLFKQSESMINNSILQTSLGNAYESLGKLSQAESNYEEATYMVPGSFYNKYVLFQFYSNTGQVAKATKIARIIMDMPIRIPSPTIDLIRSKANSFLKVGVSN